ncbi:hypothetical protein LSH36_973g00046 [Paralvinella palmiformis]|uniref:J domain-containing protein n=1 Tax=Paralvinella palmiformis TaxID=53620 RepID=A0AAD9IXA2_9ANNE|nr:hypothetical protein LSH36_973g00046 [Paralvinella palmiformis]
MCLFQSFNFRVDHLDTFMVEHLGCHDDLGKMWSVIKNLLILSHGQTTVEKGFSINRQIVVENMKEASFIAQRSNHDHIGGIDNLVVMKELLAYAGSGRKRYMEYLDDVQKCRYAIRYGKVATETLKKGFDQIPGGLTSKYYRGGFEPKMSKREASLILGVSPSASKTKIKDAHKRIMLLNHPDRGGSPYMAAKINEAKDFLDK